MKKHCVAASNPFSVPQLDLTLVGHPPFSLRVVIRPYDLQPKHLATKTIDTCVDWESIRFQFVISVDMPAEVWTWVHVSPPLQSMPASHFTTVGIHFLQQSLNQMPGNCIALSSPCVPHASVTRQTTRPIYLLLYSSPNFSFVEFCILSPKT